MPISPSPPASAADRIGKCCASSHSMTCGRISASANSRTVRRSSSCSSVGRKSITRTVQGKRDKGKGKRRKAGQEARRGRLAQTGYAVDMRLDHFLVRPFSLVSFSVCRSRRSPQPTSPRFSAPIPHRRHARSRVSASAPAWSLSDSSSSTRTRTRTVHRPLRAYGPTCSTA